LLIHLGRKDIRAKLDGRFADPLAVETALLGHPRLHGAAVMVREDRPAAPRLVAYVVSAPGPAPSVTDLREFLRARLGEHPVPSAFVFLDALPRTPIGKIDRRTLPPPDRTRPKLAAQYVPPRTAMEETVARIWAEVLELDEIGMHDDFLELGGSSLQATRVVARVAQRFHVEISLRTLLLEAPRVLDMVAVILEHLLRGLEPGARERLLASVEGIEADDAGGSATDDRNASG